MWPVSSFVIPLDQETQFGFFFQFRFRLRFRVLPASAGLPALVELYIKFKYLNSIVLTFVAISVILVIFLISTTTTSISQKKKTKQNKNTDDATLNQNRFLCATLADLRTSPSSEYFAGPFNSVSYLCCCFYFWFSIFLFFLNSKCLKSKCLKSKCLFVLLVDKADLPTQVASTQKENSFVQKVRHKWKSNEPRN